MEWHKNITAQRNGSAAGGSARLARAAAFISARNSSGGADRPSAGAGVKQSAVDRGSSRIVFLSPLPNEAEETNCGNEASGIISQRVGQ